MLLQNLGGKGKLRQNDGRGNARRFEEYSVQRSDNAYRRIRHGNIAETKAKYKMGKDLI